LDGPLYGCFERPVQWFYDPMAVPSFAGRLGEAAVVYDCMDELSQFKFAPPEIVERERQLLALADVVFTGGRKMFESKSRFNSNCHFHGCGVDVAHFNHARLDETVVPREVAALPGPILGYFGVVDERLDYELIAALAEENPDWNVVMIGPVVKVDPAILPRRPNIHWLGRREYRDLPGYTKAFDVCLMPFALNEATEYINPTKALEYMATARPIVSSAVPDVVTNFGEVVRIARSHEMFIRFCREALDAPDEAAIARGLRMAEENQWEAIVGKLERRVEEALRAKGETGSPFIRKTNTETIPGAAFAAAAALNPDVGRRSGVVREASA
jgi:glycosyltransferase involved in cell wall biosynthesis